MQTKMQSRLGIVDAHYKMTLNCYRPPKPRKYPQQSRSKMLVMSIQQACLEVFERTEADRVTMSLIAGHAGVTKGSIYQYFNGIDSVIGSIYDRTIERTLRRTVRGVGSESETSNLTTQLAEFDTLFARSYYRDFYRHALARDKSLSKVYR